MDHTVLLILVAIGLASLVSQWLAWRIRVPAILFLLAFGIVLGPLTGVLQPDALFGDLLMPFVSLAVAVILFEGSLTLRREDIKGHGAVVRNLVSWGVIVTWLLVAAITHWFLGVKWPVAFLFGAIMTVTGPTVIMPMLAAVRPKRSIANILRWEGILIDPVGAILAVLTFNVILAAQLNSSAQEIVFLFGKMLGAGLIIGGGIGYLWGLALRNYWVPQSLHNVATLLVVFAVFAAADVVASESGLLAVTVMGVWMANMRGLHIDEILDFKESLSVLLISGLFILLAARLNFAELQAVGWPALILLLGMQLFVRPLKVMLCSIGSNLSLPEKALISWIGPRGIVAAAISAVFAMRLQQRGFEEAGLLVPLAFVVIVGTVVLQSFTAAPLARLLGVADPEPEGVLIVGANAFSRALAKALQAAEFRVLLADGSWEGLRPARMDGIGTYHGNPMSDHAERTMDLAGIGKVFAVSRDQAFNHLVCAHFAGEFGRQNVYALPVAIRDAAPKAEKHELAEENRGRRLFGEKASLSQFLIKLGQGAELKSTQLREGYCYADFVGDNGDRREPLVAWSAKGQLAVFSAEKEWEPDSGWTVLSLTSPA